jgi:dihydrofolate reductase
MRKVVLYTLMSVDGAVESPLRYFPDFDSVLSDLEARLVSTQDAALLGRTMFDEWSDYWPKIEQHPFAEYINRVKKYVVTSRPITKSWGDVEAVTGPLDEFVRNLKARPGADIGVHGSIQLAKSLLAAGLVDELHLAVGPVIDPTGRRLFERLDSANPPEPRRLELLGATPTPGGAVWLSYRLV